MEVMSEVVVVVRVEWVRLIQCIQHASRRLVDVAAEQRTVDNHKVVWIKSSEDAVLEEKSQTNVHTTEGDTSGRYPEVLVSNDDISEMKPSEIRYKNTKLDEDASRNGYVCT